MGSVYADLDRPPLSPAGLRRALAGSWDVRVVGVTGSTNADVAAAAARGAAEGLVVVAEEQTAGRGRLDRAWTSPPRAGLTFSVLLRPAVPAARWPLLPLLAGCALADAVAERTGLDVRLKWPNDLLDPDGGKLAGVLAESAAGAVVLGVGLNVSTRPGELPPGAASLRTAGAEHPDREPLLREVLRRLAAGYRSWHGELPAGYRSRCDTVGREVRVGLPGGDRLDGRAEDVDDDGRLVLADAAGTRHRLAAADVTHLRRREDGAPRC